VKFQLSSFSSKPCNNPRMVLARRGIAVAILACSAAGSFAQVPSPSYDLIIRNGRILDGTGSPWFSGELAIRNGHIAAITAPNGLKDAAATTVIDAAGKIVAPGFIDMLGQSERSVLNDPYVPSKLFQGITSEVTGEGQSIAPRNDAMIAAELAGLPAETAAPEFHTLAEYFQRLESQGSAINLGTYVGAATVRRMVLGDEDRAPTPDELTRMEQLVHQAMREGAIGLSTSLMYAPGVYAKTDELIALAQAAHEDGGIYATHLRSEADAVLPALDESFRIGREAHIPVNIWHLKVAGPNNWGKMPEVIRRIEQARADGLDVAANTYAYTYSGNPASALLPPRAHAGGEAAMVARLHDPATRARIRDAMEHDRTWDNEWFMFKGPEDVVLSSTYAPALKPLIGKTLAEIATTQGKDPQDCVMDLLAEDPRIGVLLGTMSEAEVALALKQPWVAVGLDASGTSASDPAAGRHPRAFGTFPHILRKYVREEGLLTLPDAIRKFTSLPAGRLHLADRGVLKAGMWADVVIFDPAKVRDLATFERPNQLSEGMEWVLVNGVPVIAEGKLTEKLPGKVIRGPGYPATSH
jgi:N-acyl-D-amino-acid deacylase